MKKSLRTANTGNEFIFDFFSYLMASNTDRYKFVYRIRKLFWYILFPKRYYKIKFAYPHPHGYCVFGFTKWQAFFLMLFFGLPLETEVFTHNSTFDFIKWHYCLMIESNHVRMLPKERLTYKAFINYDD